MLFGIKLFFRQFRIHAQSVDQNIAHFFFFIRLCIYRTESLKCHFRCRYGKHVFPRSDLHRSRLIFCRLHPACGKPFPDQLIQTELISGERLFQRSRCHGNVRRSDCLMRVLYLLLSLFICFSCCCILCAVILCDVRSRRCICFL